MFFNLSAQRKNVLKGTVQETSETHSAGQRFSLQGGMERNLARQPVRLPAGYRRIRIITGRAYMTYNREDHILHSGSELLLEHGSEDSVISCMGSNTLIFDILK